MGVYGMKCTKCDAKTWEFFDGTRAFDTRGCQNISTTPEKYEAFLSEAETQIAAEEKISEEMVKSMLHKYFAVCGGGLVNCEYEEESYSDIIWRCRKCHIEYEGEIPPLTCNRELSSPLRDRGIKLVRILSKFIGTQRKSVSLLHKMIVRNMSPQNCCGGADFELLGPIGGGAGSGLLKSDGEEAEP
jgi:hypothetical protein